MWGTSTITRLLNNEAYIGTVYYNRREHYEGTGKRGARNRKTRHRERPREEWIPIPVPAIIDRDAFDRVKQVSRDNSKWNPRGAKWGVWLLRGLIECGHCHLGCNRHRMRRRNGTWHRYYYCRGHDPCAPAQVWIAALSATSALMSSTNTSSRRSARRCLTLGSCSLPSAP